jgi:hypothetical protein
MKLIEAHEKALNGLPYIHYFHKQSMPFQHCVWNCRMVRGKGVTGDPGMIANARDFAEEMSELKEQIDHAYADLRDKLVANGCFNFLPPKIKKKITDSANSAGQPSDYQDNETGRNCGEKILDCDWDGNWRNDEKCEDCCIDSGVGRNTPDGPPDRPWGPRS